MFCTIRDYQITSSTCMVNNIEVTIFLGLFGILGGLTFDGFGKTSSKFVDALEGFIRSAWSCY